MSPKDGMKAKCAPGRAPSQPNRFVLFVRHSYPGAIPAHVISFLLEQPEVRWAGFLDVQIVCFDPFALNLRKLSSDNIELHPNEDISKESLLVFALANLRIA